MPSGTHDYVFVPDPVSVVLPGLVESYDGDDALVRILSPAESGAEEKSCEEEGKLQADPVRVPRKALTMLEGMAEWSLLQASPPVISDLIQLSSVNQPSILFTLRQRYVHGLIYTSIGSILIALNPFRAMPALYNKALIDAYSRGGAHAPPAHKKEVLGDHPDAAPYTLAARPHAYAVAQQALDGISPASVDGGSSQSLVISGESGAGKTETTKHCLRYLAATSGSKDGPDAHIRVQNASPVLEAWGNAKTLRNNNSSRFGKFTEIWFDMVNGKQVIAGASITTYLLEKSRVVGQEAGERNYHVFYQLLQGLGRAGAKAAATIAELKIDRFVDDPTLCRLINQSGCFSIDGVDDSADYEEVQEALQQLGIDASSIEALNRIVAGIMHCGNIEFSPVREGEEDCKLEGYAGQPAGDAVSHCAELFGVSAEEIEQSLLKRKVQRGGDRRASIAYRAYTKEEAAIVRDGMTKEVYRRTFDWIVAKINELVKSVEDPGANTGRKFIGILDIFGFEIFVVNSFEQLCINLCNEVLQQHFNQSIFKKELSLYESEGIEVPDLSFNDNTAIIELLTQKRLGCLSLLDEEGMVIGGSTAGYMHKLENQHGTRGSRPSANFHKSPKDRPEEFVVEHYAGKVKYNCKFFMAKNKDTLAADITALLAKSSFSFMAGLFPTESEADAEESSRGATKNSGTKQTVAKIFTAQLEALSHVLDQTTQQYVRCIKPNSTKMPDTFNAQLTNEQLLYSGVFEAVVVMRNGYPYRLPHVQFVSRYHMLSLRRIFLLAVLHSQVVVGASSSYLAVHKELLADTAHGSEKCARFFELLLGFSSQADDVRLVSHTVRHTHHSHGHHAHPNYKHKEKKEEKNSSSSRSSSSSNSSSSSEDEKTADEAKDSSHAPHKLSAVSSELSECLVGKTLIFYRMRQHYLLESYRKKVCKLAAILIQRNLLRYCVQKHSRAVLVHYTFLRDFLVSRSVEANSETTRAVEENSEIEKLKMHLEQLRGGVDHLQAVTRFRVAVVQETVRVANLYMGVLEFERDKSASLMDNLKGMDLSGGVDVGLLLDRFDQCCELLAELDRNVHLETTYFAVLFDEKSTQRHSASRHEMQYHIEYHWTHNAALVNAQKSISKNKKNMQLFQVFEEGIAEQDELLLIQAIDSLQARKERLHHEKDERDSSADVSTAPDFWDRLFLDQQRRAKAILLPSQQAFSTFLERVQEGIGEGAMNLTGTSVQVATISHAEDHYSSDNEQDMQYTCSSMGLKALLSQLGYPYGVEIATSHATSATGSVAAKSSRRIEAVVTMLHRLCALRIMVEKISGPGSHLSWDDVRIQLLPWLPQIPQTDSSTAQSASANDASSKRERSYSSFDDHISTTMRPSVAPENSSSSRVAQRRNSRLINASKKEVKEEKLPASAKDEAPYVPSSLSEGVHKELCCMCRAVVRISLCPLLANAVRERVLPAALTTDGVVTDGAETPPATESLAERAEPFVSSIMQALYTAEPYLRFFEDSEALLTRFLLPAQQHYLLKHAVMTHSMQTPPQGVVHTSTAQLRIIMTERCDLVRKSHPDYVVASHIIQLESILEELRDLIVGTAVGRPRAISRRLSARGSLLPPVYETTRGDKDALSTQGDNRKSIRRRSSAKISAVDASAIADAAASGGAILTGRLGERKLTHYGVMSVNLLAICLRRATSLPIAASSATWTDLLRWGEHVHHLRSLASAGELVAARQYVSGVLDKKEQAALAATGGDSTDSETAAVPALLESMVRESALWALEAEHEDAYVSLLADVVQCGTISGVIGELYLRNSRTEEFGAFSVTTAQLLMPYEGKLVTTAPAVVQLIASLDVLLPLRSIVSKGKQNISELTLESVTIPVERIHEKLQTEYRLIMDEVIDRSIQKRLSLALSAGQITLADNLCDVEDNDVNASSILTEELAAAVVDAEVHRSRGYTDKCHREMVSAECLVVLLSAKVVLAIRQCVKAQRWEPPGPHTADTFVSAEGGLFCGRMSLRDMMRELADKSRLEYFRMQPASDDVSQNIRLAFATVEELGSHNMSNSMFFDDYFAESDAADPLGEEEMFAPICVAGLLGYVSSLAGLSPLIATELTVVQITSVERRMRLLLFLSASYGAISGTVDTGFDMSRVHTSLLSNALAYVRRYEPLLAPSTLSGLVATWMVASATLLRTRLVIVSAATTNVSTYLQSIHTSAAGSNAASVSGRSRSNSSGSSVSAPPDSITVGAGEIVESLLSASHRSRLGSINFTGKEGASEEEEHDFFALANKMLAGPKAVFEETLQSTVNVAGLVDLVRFLTTPFGQYKSADEYFSGASSVLKELRECAVVPIGRPAQTVFLGFPTRELVLIIDKISDLRYERDVLSAMQSGRLTFYHGKIEISEVAFRPLEEALKASRFHTSMSINLSIMPNPYGSSDRVYVLPDMEVNDASAVGAVHKRSYRLDKLCFFAEVCVNIRKAVLSRQNVEEFTAMNDLAARLSDFDKVCAIFAGAKDIISGDGSSSDGRRPSAARIEAEDLLPIPPTSLLEEITLVQYDMQRRAYINGFKNAFKAGAVNGYPTRLSLYHVNTNKLASQVELVKNSHDVSIMGDEECRKRSAAYRQRLAADAKGNVNDPLSIMMQAAHEVINIRNAAMTLNQKYIRDNSFAAYEDSLMRPLAVDVRILLENMAKSDAKASDATPAVLLEPGRRTSLTLQLTEANKKARLRRTNLEELSRIINNTSYIDDAISAAVSETRSLAGHGAEGSKVTEKYIMRDWLEIKQLLVSVVAADKINHVLGTSGTRGTQSVYNEIDLLTEESFLRSFLAHAVGVLHDSRNIKNQLGEAAGGLSGSERRRSGRFAQGIESSLIVDESGFISEMDVLQKNGATLGQKRDVMSKYLLGVRHLHNMYVLRQEALKAGTSIESKSSASYRFDHAAQSSRPHTQLCTFVQNSLVALVCLWSARESNAYEPLNRDWANTDPNYIYTPRFHSLVSSMKDESPSEKPDGARHTVQGVLRALFELNGFYHSCIKVEVDDIMRDLEDEISYAEMSEALLAGNGSDAAVAAVSSSTYLDLDLLDITVVDTSLLHRALERISTRFPINRSTYKSTHINDNGETQTNYLSQLEVACHIITRLRDLIRKYLYAEAFAVVDRFLQQFVEVAEPRSLNLDLGEGKAERPFKDVLMQVYARKYTIHPLAAVEFSYYCAFLVDQQWQQHSLASLTSGCIRGARGGIHVLLGRDSLSWRAIDEVLSFLPIMVSCSKATNELTKLMQMVRRLRSDVLDVSISEDANLGFAVESPVDYVASIISASMRGACRHYFSNINVSAATRLQGTVERAASLLEFASRIGPSLRTQRERLQFSLHSEVQDSLVEESLLAEEHSVFLHRRTRLLVALKAPTIWTNSTGIEVSSHAHAELAKAIATAKEMRWNVHASSEFIWKKLLNIAIRIVSIGDYIIQHSLVNSGSTTAALSFGTLEMPVVARQLQLIKSKIFCYNEIVAAHSVPVTSNSLPSYRAYLDHVLKDTHEPASFALLVSQAEIVRNEEKCLQWLRAVLGHGVEGEAEYLVEHDEGSSHLLNSNNALRDAFTFDNLQVRLLAADLQLNREAKPGDEAPDRASAELLEVLTSLRKNTSNFSNDILSSVGHSLQGVACVMLDLRIAIWKYDYTSALSLLELLPILVEQVRAATPSMEILVPDLPHISNFVKAVQLRRMLQQGLTAVAFPPVVGWSSFGTLGDGSRAAVPHSFVLNINDACMREAVTECSAAGKVLLTSPLLHDLLETVRLLMTVVSAIRRSAWLDQSSAMDQSATQSFVASLAETYPAFDVLLDIFDSDWNGPTVASGILALAEHVKSSSTMGVGIRRYLRFLLSSINAEMTYVLLQKHVVQIFEDIRISGNIGAKELHIPAKAEWTLQKLIVLLARADKEVVPAVSIWFQISSVESHDDEADVCSLDEISAVIAGVLSGESTVSAHVVEMDYIHSIVRASIGLQQALQSAHILMQAHSAIQAQRNHSSASGESDIHAAGRINQLLGDVLSVMNFMQQESTCGSGIACNDPLTFGGYLEERLANTGNVGQIACLLSADELMELQELSLFEGALEKVAVAGETGVQCEKYMYENTLLSLDVPDAALAHSFLPFNTCTTDNEAAISLFRLRPELLSDYEYLWKQNSFHCQYQEYIAALYPVSESENMMTSELCGVLTSVGVPGDLSPLDTTVYLEPLWSVLQELFSHELVNLASAESSISLTLAEINASISESLLHGTRVGQGELLYFAVKAVYNLRKGRKYGDSGIVRATLKAISVHNDVDNAVYSNYYLSLAAQEIKLMSADLVQRDRIELMEQVITRSRGLTLCFSDAEAVLFGQQHQVDVDVDTPGNTLDLLTEAGNNGSGSKLLLYCKKAQALYDSVLCVYRMRTLAVRREWLKLRAYVEGFSEATADAGSLVKFDTSVFSNVVDCDFEELVGQEMVLHPDVNAEMQAARQVASIMLALEACCAAYNASGRITGVAGDISLGGGQVSADTEHCMISLHAAGTALADLDASWQTRLVQQHADTVCALAQIRRGALADEWYHVHSHAALLLNLGRSVSADRLTGMSHDLGGSGESRANYALNFKDAAEGGFQEPHPLARTEVELAYRHACYQICDKSLSAAIRSNGISGTVGCDLDYSFLNISPLVAALQVVERLSPHFSAAATELTSAESVKNIERLKRTAELLLRLRTAQLRGHWCNVSRPRPDTDAAHVAVSSFSALSNRRGSIVGAIYNHNVRISDMYTDVHGLRALETTHAVVAAVDISLQRAGLHKTLVEIPKTGSTEAFNWLSQNAKSLDPEIFDRTQSSKNESVEEIFEEYKDSIKASMPEEYLSTESAASYTRNQDLISNEAKAEITLAKKELLYREVCCLLLYAVLTPGIHGIPGVLDFDSPKVDISSLQNTVDFVETEGYDVIRCGSVRWLLRDAYLLLNIRRARVPDTRAAMSDASGCPDWVALKTALDDFDRGNADYYESKRYYSERLQRTFSNDVSLPIIYPVYAELELVRHDLHFNLCVVNFSLALQDSFDLTQRFISNRQTSEDSRSTQADDLNGSAELRTIIDAELKHRNSRKIADLVELLSTTQSYYNSYLKNDTGVLEMGEFKRLLLAIELALELRIARHNDPEYLPYTVAKRVEDAHSEELSSFLQLKRTDAVSPRSCSFISYIAMLRPEIHQLQSFFSKEQYLFSLKCALENGQTYLLAPIGFITSQHLSSYNEELRLSIAEAYTALRHSFEKRDLEVLKYAQKMLDLREAVRAENWLRVGMILGEYAENPAVDVPLTKVGDIHFGHFAMDSFHQKRCEALMCINVSKEIARCRLEITDRDSASELAAALRVGRLVDIYAIARCIHDSLGDNADQGLNSLARIFASATTASRGRRSSLSSGQYVDARASAQAATDAKIASGDDTGYSYRRYLPTTFQKGLTLLTAAVGKAHERRDDIMSTHLAHHLKLGELVLSMRLSVQAGRWDEVGTLLKTDYFETSHVSQQAGDSEALEVLGLEELNAIRAAMRYRTYVQDLSSAMLNGCVRGTQSSAQLSDVHFLPLQIALEKANLLRQTAQNGSADCPDNSNPAFFVFDIASIVCDIRRAILDDHWTVEDVTDDSKFNERETSESESAIVTGDDSHFDIADMSPKKKFTNNPMHKVDVMRMDQAIDADQSLGGCDIESISEDASVATVELVLQRLFLLLQTVAKDFNWECPVNLEEILAAPEALLKSATASFELTAAESEAIASSVQALRSSSFAATAMNYAEALEQSVGFTDELDHLMLVANKNSTLESSESGDWVWALLRALHCAFYELQLVWFLLEERKMRVEILACLATFDSDPRLSGGKAEQDALKTSNERAGLELRHHRRHGRRRYSARFSADASDLYHVEPLRAALDAAARCKANRFGREMCGIMKSAELILRFREAYTQLSANSSVSSKVRGVEMSIEQLIGEFQGNRGSYSDAYGVSELRYFDSVTSQVSLTQVELKRHLSQGQVRGPIDALELSAIDNVPSLRRVYQHALQLAGTTSGNKFTLQKQEEGDYVSFARVLLTPLLQQAQLVLLLREAVLSSEHAGGRTGNDDEEGDEEDAGMHAPIVLAVEPILAHMDKRAENAPDSDLLSYTHLASNTLLPDVMAEVSHVRAAVQYHRMRRNLWIALHAEHPVRDVGIGIGAYRVRYRGHSRFEDTEVTNKDLSRCMGLLLPRIEPLRRLLSDAAALLAYDSALLMDRKQHALMEDEDSGDEADAQIQSRHLLASRGSGSLLRSRSTALALFDLMTAVVDDNWGTLQFVQRPASLDVSLCTDPILHSFVFTLALQERAGAFFDVHADIKKLALLRSTAAQEGFVENQAGVASAARVAPTRNIRNSIVGLAFVPDAYANIGAGASLESWETKAESGGRRASRRVSVSTAAFTPGGGTARRQSINDVTKLLAGSASVAPSTTGPTVRRGSILGGNKAKAVSIAVAPPPDKHRRRSLLIVENVEDSAKTVQKSVLQILFAAQLDTFGPNVRCWFELARDSFIDQVTRLRLQAVCCNPEYQVQRNIASSGSLGGELVVAPGCVQDLSAVLNELSRVLHCYRAAGTTTGLMLHSPSSLSGPRERLDAKGRPRGYHHTELVDDESDEHEDLTDYVHRWSTETLQWIFIAETLVRLRTAVVHEGEEEVNDEHRKVDIFMDTDDRIDCLIMQELQSLQSRLEVHMTQRPDSESGWDDSALGKVWTELRLLEQYAAEYQAELMVDSCLGQLENFFHHYASGAEHVHTDVTQHKNDASSADMRTINEFVFDKFEKFVLADNLRSVVSVGVGVRPGKVIVKNVFQQVEWCLSPLNRPLCMMQPHATDYFAVLETVGHMMAIGLQTAFLNYRSQYKTLAIREKLSRYLYGGAVMEEEDISARAAAMRLEDQKTKAALEASRGMMSLFGSVQPAPIVEQPVPVALAKKDAATEENTVLGGLLKRSLVICDTALAIMSMEEERATAVTQGDDVEQTENESLDKKWVQLQDDENACVLFGMNMLHYLSTATSADSDDDFEDAVDLAHALCDDITGTTAADPQHSANLAILGRHSGWLVVVKMLVCLIRRRTVAKEALQAARELVSQIRSLQVWSRHVVTLQTDPYLPENLEDMYTLMQAEHPHLVEPTVGRGPDSIILVRIVHMLREDPHGRYCVDELRRYVQHLCEMLQPGSAAGRDEQQAAESSVDIEALLDDKSIYENKVTRANKAHPVPGASEGAAGQSKVAGETTAPQELREGVSSLQSLLLSFGTEK